MRYPGFRCAVVVCEVLASALVLQGVAPASAEGQVKDSARVRVMRGANPRRVVRVRLDTASVAIDTVVHHTERDSVIEKIWPAIMQLGAASFYVYEYHDEQKFIVGDRYGPMVHVFVSPYLGQLTHHRQFDNHGAAGVLVAVVYVNASRGEVLGSPYQNLNLSPGLNCLHLVHDRQVLDDRDGWSAYITRAASDTTCPHDYAQNRQQALQVNATLSPSAQFFDYPTAARIADDDQERPVIGLRCGSAWCEIGPRGFRSRPPQHEADQTLLPSRENRIKGWHDEQRLADIVSGRPVPSQLRASLIPVANLTQRDEDDYLRRYLPVAVIWLPRDPEPSTVYFRDWGLRAGQNVLYARKLGSNEWVSYIEQARTGTRFPMKVIRRTHWDVAMPGTARWRWSANDEVIWYDCGGACCESFR